MLKEIKSTQNEYIKFLNTLQNKKNIVKNDLCLIESDKIVLECINNNLVTVKKVLVTESKLKLFDIIRQNHNNIEFIVISDEVAKKLSNTVTTTGVFAVAKLNDSKDFNTKTNFLVLDGLQDPTNVGAIIRSAVAFDYTQILLINSAYPFTSKVIRSSMGYAFKVNFIETTPNQLSVLKDKHNLQLVCASMNGENINNHKIIGSHGLILGNEGQGVSENIMSLCNEFVSINMQNNVESLNVAVSASIIMHNLCGK